MPFSTRSQVSDRNLVSISLNGRHTLPASPEVLWALLHQPEDWNGWLRRLDERHYRVTFDVAVGPLKGNYGGFLTMEPAAEGEALHWQLEAQSPRGEIKASGSLKLEAAGDETILGYEGEMALSGEVAILDARLVASNARAGIRRLFEALVATLNGEAPAAHSEYRPPITDYEMLPTLLKGAVFVISFLLLYRLLRRQGQ